MTAELVNRGKGVVMRNHPSRPASPNRTASALVALALLAAAWVLPGSATAADVWLPQTAGLGTSLDDFTGVSCPTTTHCVVADGNNGIYTTDDGGAQWTRHDYSMWYDWTIQSVACPSALHCVGVGTTRSGLPTMAAPTGPSEARVAGARCLAPPPASAGRSATMG
jgi:hypothetical protein